MTDQHAQLANTLSKTLSNCDPHLHAHPDNPVKIVAYNNRKSAANLDLTPFVAKAAEPTALSFFSDVKTVSDLITAYHAARKSQIFEADLPEAMTDIDPYANEYLNGIFTAATQIFSNDQAELIAAWVKDLDTYCAVKAVESLLNSKADLALLEVAKQQNWIVHFDHLAIRCGSQNRKNAERIATLLIEHHGYTAPQIPEEAFYQFPEGWNAYPLYKMLNNGQVLRLFIDQSDDSHPSQIIQHWNRVYGYTAHHLAMRASTLESGHHKAITLPDVMQALKDYGINIMTSTGEYTSGLLLQVFTRPEKNTHIPDALKKDIAHHGEHLNATIENAKLLEIVSRKELEPDFAAQYFALYGITYNATNPLHSAPIYQYFLPAQAAHVIKTSQQVA